MIEVIPNWHPVFVHFTVALLSMSVVFFVALKLVNKESIQTQLETMAYWNLWLGTGFAIVTAIAGWFAYNSVAHDTPSHAAMTDHRNWALITVSVFVIATVWSVNEYKKNKPVSSIFVFVMLMALLLLASTSWRGGEVVYRFGLGVMSLPQAEGEGHDHEHADGEEHMSIDKREVNEVNDIKATVKKDTHDHSTHKH